MGCAQTLVEEARAGRTGRRVARRRRPGRRRLRADRHPGALGVGDPAEHPHPLRRPLRAGPDRRAEPHRRDARQRLGGRAQRGAGRRGPRLLHRAGHQPARHRPGAVRQRAGRRRRAGRLHDHPAVRQERLPHQRADLHPQGEGGVHRAEDDPPADQGGDPRGLPQHHLLRPRGLRHPGRDRDLLRRRAPARRSGCPSPRPRCSPRASGRPRRTTRSATRSGPRTAGTTCWTAW